MRRLGLHSAGSRLLRAATSIPTRSRMNQVTTTVRPIWEEPHPRLLHS